MDCPNDLPAACPSPQPSYSSQVAPVIQNYCLKCHSGAGPGIGDFRTYPSVFANRQAILTQFYSCRMPPQGEPQPGSQERALLLGWLVCGAPNN
jgi:hypothetical protein